MKKFSTTYGTEYCKEMLDIVLDSRWLDVKVTTSTGDEIVRIVPATHMALLRNGVSQQLEIGETLYVVYDPISVMGQLRSAANFAHLLFHMNKLRGSTD